MVVNIARLKGKIVERGNTQEAVANAMKIVYNKDIKY